MAVFFAVCVTADIYQVVLCLSTALQKCLAKIEIRSKIRKIETIDLQFYSAKWVSISLFLWDMLIHVWWGFVFSWEG